MSSAKIRKSLLSIKIDRRVEVSDSVVKAAKRVLNAGALQLIPGTEAEVELIFTDAAEIKNLNAENRNKDAVTDVLSFPELDLEPGQSPSEAAGLTDIWGGKLFLGSIVICDSRAKEQAAEFGHSEEREFAFLAAHSLLHLLGWDHERGPEEEKEMFALQEKILRSVGLTR